MTYVTSRVIPRQLSYVFYEKDSDHYTEGSAQIFIYGDRGFMFGIVGKGFFKVFVPESIKFLKKNNLKTLEGYMSRQNARSVRMAYSKFNNVDVTIGPLVNIDGHDVHWVTVALKDE